MFKHKRFFLRCLVAGFGVFLLVLTPQAVLAKTDSSTNTQAVAQSYGSDKPLQKGLIVKLKDGDANMVVPVTQEFSRDIEGVVVAASDAPVTLTGNSEASDQIYVASFGRFDVLVSNQNGAIRAGDYVTISSLAGVGMKADTEQPVVLGKAVGNFDGTSNVESSTSLKDENGGTKPVAIGRVPVAISISHNPLEQAKTNYIPGLLEHITTSIANKPVTAARIYLGIAILLASAIIAGSLLYSGIRNSLIAVGRNPLAKKSIMRGLLQTVFASLIIFIVGVFGVYLILKL